MVKLTHEVRLNFWFGYSLIVVIKTCNYYYLQLLGKVMKINDLIINNSVSIFEDAENSKFVISYNIGISPVVEFCQQTTYQPTCCLPIVYIKCFVFVDIPPPLTNTRCTGWIRELEQSRSRRVYVVGQLAQIANIFKFPICK